MGGITTHVLDTTHGRPAAGMHVVLEQMDGRDRWDPVGRGVTDADGRVRTLMAESVTPAPGIYRLVFDSRGYFDSQGVRTFYPAITVTFEVAAGGASHYHVPLLLSPFGYSTYRGS
jgi:5-hydroxyisourate hydrolase